MQVKVKPKGAQPLVVSANRLRDGRVVWLADGDRWAETLAEARIFPGAAVAEGLQAAIEAEHRQLVVGGYEIEVAVSDAGIVPLRARERFRAAGPSVGQHAA